MPVAAPVHSALPAAQIGTVRSGGPALPAAAAAGPSAREPVDLVSLSPLATQYLALAPPTAALRQLGGLLHDAQEIEQLVRTPPAAAMGELAVEIAAAADALATQLPRPVEAPASADTHPGGLQQGAPHPASHGHAASAPDHDPGLDPGRDLDPIAGREQRLREDATTMLGRAADTLARMQQHLQGIPPEEAGAAARIAASAVQVARARQRLQGGPSSSPAWLRPRPMLMAMAVVVAVAGLCWASRLDLHVARGIAGGAVGLCVAGWLAAQIWRRRPGWRTMRIEFRR